MKKLYLIFRNEIKIFLEDKIDFRYIIIKSGLMPEIILNEVPVKNYINNTKF